jgi:hypothetical protein
MAGHSSRSLDTLTVGPIQQKDQAWVFTLRIISFGILVYTEVDISTKNRVNKKKEKYSTILTIILLRINNGLWKKVIVFQTKEIEMLDGLVKLKMFKVLKGVRNFVN